eukprot:g4910.t1
MTPLRVRQLFDRESCTYTYIVHDEETREAVLIDPVVEHAERDATVLAEMKVKLIYVMNTHVHADHITGSGKLKEIMNTEGREGEPLKSVIGDKTGATADMHVADRDKVHFGNNRYVAVRHCPGHTPGCVAYVTDDEKCVFTGDALLIRGCGRTDFQGGSPDVLYDSVWNQLLNPLDDSTVVYPGHDYNGRTCSTVGEEKEFNPRLRKDKDAFIAFMKERFDGSNYPKKLDASLPANMACGVY